MSTVPTLEAEHGGPAPFDVCGPLPRGVTVLEASAGTGKTFAIAALAARYIAAGVPLGDLLLVTFTRMATGELRERVRERLLSAEQALGDRLAGADIGADDVVGQLLADAEPATIATRRRRLAAALADFDSATIITTHGFCQQMLASLGIAGNAEADTTLVEEIDDLVEETVDDLVAARVLRGSASPMRRADALQIARGAIGNPRIPIAAVDAEPDSPPRIRRALAFSARRQVEDRKHRAHLITYDDLLIRLVDAIGDPVTGPAALARLRSRFGVVLVDEFQDTDELQWQILSRAFTPGPADRQRALVLIGDPKQAIYAFRGADVHAYLAATRSAVATQSLGVNWRADQPLLDAYDVLFGQARLGHPDIVYRQVRAAPGHLETGLEGVPHPEALRLRIVHRGDRQVARTAQGWVSVASARQLIARDLAADIVSLTGSGAQIAGRDAEGARSGGRPLRPGDIAVLTARHRDSTLVRDALAAAGVPVVINGAGSVFATAVARHWLLLLEAVERPTSPYRVRAAALTPFVGWTAAQLDVVDEAAWEELHATFHRWAAVLATSGVATMLEVVTRATRLPARLLGTLDGERQLTDLRHIGQLLHAEAAAGQLGVTALAGWLRRRMADAAGDNGTEERSRRLESDADAVQVLTVYRSKGLEYPIVYVPYLWDPSWIPPGGPIVYHDRGTDDAVRTIDVSAEGTSFERHKQWSLEEQRGEDLRLAYVALTRAKHQAVVWWAGSFASRDSALGRLLFAQGPDGSIPPGGPPSPRDDEVVAHLEQLAARRPGRIAVERVAVDTEARWAPGPARLPVLSATAWDRRIDTAWRRTSYSGLTAEAHDETVTSEPEHLGLADEAEADADVTAGADADAGAEDPETAARLRAVTLPLAAMPGGTRVGSFVHAVLEAVDFDAADLPAALAEAIAALSARWPVPIGDPAVVVSGLSAALRTPLGALAGDRCLADLGRADRLDELAFEIAVAGGDRPRGRVGLGDIADLLDEHLAGGDPLRTYPARLRERDASSAFHGYLTGSLDLVARFADPGRGETRYTVMDYKTNLLGADAERRRAWDYRPAALAVAMEHAHYPLQALLYSVALHRYLRWRVPGYDPGRHLGGVLYLFVRGMVGPDSPTVDGQRCGVFSWSPPASVIQALSDLLEKGRPG